MCFSLFNRKICLRRARELLLYHNVLQFIASRLKKQLLNTPESKNLSFVSQLDLLSREERSYYYRILDMAKEREAAKLKIPATNTGPQTIPSVTTSPKKGSRVVVNSLKEEEERKGDVLDTKFVKFSFDSNDSNDSNDEEILSVNSIDRRAYHVHGRILRQWINSLLELSSLHNKMSLNMRRGESYKEHLKAFQQVFNAEAKRNFHHVYTSSCSIEIKPLKVENIPLKNTYVHGKISYGESVRQQLIFQLIFDICLCCFILDLSHQKYSILSLYDLE